MSDKNSWGDKFEKDGSKTGNGILLEQDYGKEEEWREHFYYLLPFLKDERYIKYHGKPVFLIYKPKKIYCLLRMVELWKKLAKEEGIPGIYVIGINVGYKVPGLDAVLMLGPGAYQNIDLTGKRAITQKQGEVSTCRYEEIYEVAKDVRIISGEKNYLSALVDYDDTPRRGKNGFCLLDSNPELFEKNFTEILKESIRRDNEFVFINAWNEWGEGMYLEPDEKNGFGYLEAVSRSLKNVKKDNRKNEENMSSCSEKMEIQWELEHLRGHYELLHHWFQLKEQNRSASEYFIRNNYDKIALYGWGVFGKHLYKDLE